MTTRLKADLALLLVAILWGSAFVAQRVAGQLGSVYFFNGVRFLIGALILLPFVYRTKPRPNQWTWMIVAGAILFIASAFQQSGLLSTAAGNAGFITSLYVVIVPFVMFVGWREKPRILAVVAAMGAAAGAYLLSTGGRFEAQFGDLLELGGAIFWALHVVLVGKFAPSYSAVSFSAGQLFVGGALNVVASLVLEKPSLPPPAPLTASILYTSIASLALGYTLQIWGQRRTAPTDAAIILSLESVFAAVAGALLLAEHLTTAQLAGCLLILIAVILSQVGGWSRITAETASPSIGNDEGYT